MKNIIFIAVLLALWSANAPLCAQKISTKNVPQAVQTTFKTMFADAKKVKYSKETDGSFEVDFKQNDIKSSAHISAKGDWLETEQEIKKTDLPQNISQMLAKDFAGWDIETCEKVKTLEKGTFYEVFVEKGKENFELKIDETGNVFEKKPAKKSEGKDDDKDEDEKKDKKDKK